MKKRRTSRPDAANPDELTTCLPEGSYLINPKHPERTAAQFLDWLTTQPRQPRPTLLSRETMHARIYSFLDTVARWKTSCAGPVRRGPRDHLIVPFVPSARDVNRVAQALRQAF